MVRRALVAVLLVPALAGVLAACGSSGDGEPVVFRGPGFSVQLPAEPERDTQSLSTRAGEVKLTIFAVEESGYALAVSVAELPLPDGFDVEASLDGAASGAASNVEGTLASSTPVTVQGRPGRDVLVTGAQGGRATVWLRLVADGKTQYQILTTRLGDGAAEPPTVHTAAVESFALG